MSATMADLVITMYVIMPVYQLPVVYDPLYSGLKI